MTDVNKIRMYKTTTSFSHILGNLTAIIEKYVKDTMPPGYFKGGVRATTEVGFKDFKNRLRNMIQMEMPFMVIDPRFLSTDESDALPQINWDRFIEIDHTADPQFYAMNSEFFLQDDATPIRLGYTFNRYKLAFRIVMYVETQMMRMSLVNYLRSNFRFRHMFPVERYTETLIPSSYIAHLAEVFGMDMMSNDFIQKLNQISKYPIVRLHRPATGRTEFFILTTSTLQLRLPDLPSEDKVMLNRMEQRSQVEFTIELECNVMNNFLLLTTETVDSPDEMMNDYMYRFYIDMDVPIPDRLSDGYTLYSKISMEFEEGEEVVDLKQFLGTDVLNEIDYIQANGLTTPYCKIQVYKGATLLDNTDTASVALDTTKYELTIKNPEENVNYSVCIYFDMAYMASVTTFINEEDLNHTPSEYEK